MRFSTTTIAAVMLLASEAVSASMISPAHVRLSRRAHQRQRRCVARHDNGDINIQNQNKPSSSSSTPPAPSPSPQNNPPPTFNSGVIQLDGNACGPSGATPDTTSQTGPNGSIDFINCGIEGSGWHPPGINLDNVIAKDLRTVLSWDGSPFSPCAPYIDAFENVSGQTGIPAILLASIAMQESTCQPWVTGKNGEVGMMQITPDKCGGVADCYDPLTNLSIGANYFRDVYNGNHNLPLSLGMYNGWFEGMTEYDANNKCCSCRNNLDYLHNVLNGFMQGISPESRNMGKYFNLQSC